MNLAYDVADSLLSTLLTVGTTAAQINSTFEPKKGVQLKARSGNSGTIYIGGTNVTSAGYSLIASETVFIPIDRLNRLWFLGSASGQVLEVLAV